MGKFNLGLGQVDAQAVSIAAGMQTQIFSGTLVAVTAGPQEPLVQSVQAELLVSETRESLGSTEALHSTLFENFQLTATPTYNFYTSDEAAVQVDVSKDVPLSELPRYVTLSWNTAPKIRETTPKSKTSRPMEERSTTSTAVLPVKKAKTAVSNGYVAAGTISALLKAPAPAARAGRFDEELFLASPNARGSAAKIATQVGTDFHVRDTSLEPRTRVNFVDPSIAGAFSKGRVAVSSDQVHLATLGALSKLASGLEVLSEFNQDVPIRNPVPRFPAPANTPPVVYIGYVIERYTLGADGSMTLSRTFDIDDPTLGILVDRDVSFGVRYSYRIRAIVQWSRPHTIGFKGQLTLERDPQVDTSAMIPTKKASFYAGDWSDWSQTVITDSVRPEPPDEIYVRPISAKGMVRITWKMPGDPQRDLLALRLVRAKHQNGRLTDWRQLGEFPASNGAYDDLDVSPVEVSDTAYVYAMYSVSTHGELSVLSEKIECRTSERHRYDGELPLRIIGPAGDDPMAHAVGLLPPPEVESMVQSRVLAYIRGGNFSLPLFSRNYSLEVQSLSTGQRTVVDLNLETTDVAVAPSQFSRRP